MPRHSLDFFFKEDIDPSKIIWKEPWGWTNGQPTHYYSFTAFIAKHKCEDGWVYVTRICSLKPLQGYD